MANQGVPTLSACAGKARTQGAGGHSHVDKEQQCVLHWFRGWSHHQKQDFLQFLLERILPHNVDSLFQAMRDLDMRDKPPSIFQCQLKLMGEWFADWTDKERNDLVIQLAAIDPSFISMFHHEVARAGHK